MKNGFIEIYDNALPDDICDYLVAVFERENMMSVSEVREFESLGDMMRRKEEMMDEFKLINSNMTLVEFKFIYFWEWFHRFFARLIGVIFLIPLLFIIFKKQLKRCAQ